MNEVPEIFEQVKGYMQNESLGELHCYYTRNGGAHFAELTFEYLDNMPRKETKLAIEQINEILEDRASEDTILALKTFLKAELDRRRYAGNRGGRPQTVADKQKANREYQATWRASQKKKK